MRPYLCAIPLVLFFAAAAAGQTFTGTVIDGDPDLFLLMSDEAGQYQATVVWDDPDDLLLLTMVCDDLVGASGGFRDRIAHLNVGKIGSDVCFIGVSPVDVLIADYTLNIQSTTSGAELNAVKVDKAEVPAEILERMEKFRREQSAVRQAAKLAGSRPTKAGPTVTFLEQIRGGIPKTFVVEAVDDVLQITAMWNRADTDLSVHVVCFVGETEVDFGTSESGQERFLRFDADVVAGTSCEVTLSSPNTMVFALNIAVYGDAGAV